MMQHTVLLILSLMLTRFSQPAFKDQQKNYPRVREAYKEKESLIISMLDLYKIVPRSLQLCLMAFKTEQLIEVWAKNKNDEQYVLIAEYTVCQTSGVLGPKRREGDLQIPEGFYHIDHFNPSSLFHLSLRINYPNPSDRILGSKTKPGGDIYIHGACVTIGCLPITDDKIKELYILCVEARNNGQTDIPVTIFPARLTESNYKLLKKTYSSDNEKLNLWADLKAFSDAFYQTKCLPSVGFLQDGRHSIR